MLADNSRHLLEAAAAEQTLVRAEEALLHAERAGQPLTVVALAAQAQSVALIALHRARSPGPPATAARPGTIPWLCGAACSAARLGCVATAPARRANPRAQPTPPGEVNDLRIQLARAVGERRATRRDHPGGSDRPARSGT
jgi:hypothetical protein